MEPSILKPVKTLQYRGVSRRLVVTYTLLVVSLCVSMMSLPNM